MFTIKKVMKKRILLIVVLTSTSCYNEVSTYRVLLDTIVSRNHILMSDRLGDTSLTLKINNSVISINSLYKKFHIRNGLDSDYGVLNCGNGNILLESYQNDLCFVISKDTVLDLIESPIITIDTVKSRILSDVKKDTLEFFIYDIPSKTKNMLKIDDINEDVYYSSGLVDAKFGENESLHIQYKSNIGIIKDTVIYYR